MKGIDMTDGPINRASIASSNVCPECGSGLDDIGRTQIVQITESVGGVYFDGYIFEMGERESNRATEVEAWICQSCGYEFLNGELEEVLRRIATRAHEIETVQEALTKADAPIEMKWHKGKGDGRDLTVEDLALGYHAVEISRKDDRGLSYAKLDRAFKVNKGVGCHNNKAARIIALLQELNLTKD